MVLLLLLLLLPARLKQRVKRKMTFFAPSCSVTMGNGDHALVVDVSAREKR